MDPKRQASTPPVKVVGFHVEGASPSPRPTTLSDTASRDVSSSPSPVIIPPLFQGQREGGPTSPVRAPSAPVGSLDEDEVPGLRPIRTTSTPLDELTGAATPSKVKSPASSGSTPRPLPITPVMSGPGGGASSDFSASTAAAAVTSPRILPGGTSSSAPAAASGTPLAAAVAAGAKAEQAAGPKPATPPSPAAAAAGQQQKAAVGTPKQQQGQGQGQQGAAAHVQPAQQQQQQQQQPKGAGKEKVQRHVEPPPKKELTKAERRAIQEAQRAAKAAAKAAQDGGAATGGKLTKQGSGSNLAKQQQGGTPRSGAAAGGGGGGAGAAAAGGDGQSAPSSSRGGRQARVSGSGAKEEAHVPTKSTELFAHLPPYRRLTREEVLQKGAAAAVPFEAVKLGLQYMDGSIRGANARCAAMLAMFMHIIKEFRTPAGRSEVAKEVLGVFNSVISFLVACRPLSVTMGNAIKYVKCELERMKLQQGLSEQQVKEEMTEKIGSYLQEKIRAADNLIVEHAIAKIQDGDVILTYSHSTLVAAVLLKAHEEGRRFSVVVADARPQLEGRRLLRLLLGGGISCEYVYLNALSFSLDRVTKVLLGAGAVLSNGTVLSRVGSAAVAMLAAAERIPVLVCCETYKFAERVQLDSITNNELGDPEDVAKLPDWMGKSPLEGWRDADQLGLLNLKYDAMPADFVSVVVTEAGLIPPTSVAVILRETRQDVMV